MGQGVGGQPKLVRQKDNLKFEFGWKHWSDGKYKLKQIDHGSGTHSVDIARDAGYEDCLQIVKKIFFANGVRFKNKWIGIHISIVLVVVNIRL